MDQTNIDSCKIQIGGKSSSFSPELKHAYDNRQNLFDITVESLIGSVASKVQIILSWILSIAMIGISLYHINVSVETKILFIICYKLLIITTINLARIVRNNEKSKKFQKYLVGEQDFTTFTIIRDGKLYIFYNWLSFFVAFSILMLGVFYTTISHEGKAFLCGSSFLIISTTFNLIKMYHDITDGNKYKTLYKKYRKKEC